MGVADDLLTTLRGRSVLVTGHTGLKGGWLSLWLNQLGAQVYGFALDPPTTPNFFDLADVGSVIHEDYRGDIRDLAALQSALAALEPDVILHLAAQPLVRASYANPLETWSTNALGTANVLHAVHQANRACAVVVVSSDKCYDNRHSPAGYREQDPLGGSDPYSASKAATELAVRSWRDSYFTHDRRIAVASARAGNVLGGGDWAADRIVPDCVRAFVAGELVELRYPTATRPWQHVLEPLGGYLMLAARLLGQDWSQFATAWNFGPQLEDVRPVSELVSMFATHWGIEGGWTPALGNHPGEARLLALDCQKAAKDLHWRPTWTLADAIEYTAQWYQAWRDDPATLPDLTRDQISSFEQSMKRMM